MKEKVAEEGKKDQADMPISTMLEPNYSWKTWAETSS